VQSKEVLDSIRPEDKLAAMDWEDFEHLVRELFEKEFAATLESSSGLKVSNLFMASTFSAVPFAAFWAARAEIVRPMPNCNGKMCNHASDRSACRR
jgi:hypothetical protein